MNVFSLFFLLLLLVATALSADVFNENDSMHNRGIPFHEEKRMQSLKRMLENNRDLLAQHAEGRKLIGENDRERVLRQIEMIEKKMDRYSAVDSKNGRAKRMHEERRAKFNEERIRERSL
eukprot:CAMPEP_0195520220 /NCGR_PEP_ID=MMETSP0794_2-20130614/16420_1 /TAXON_ID=515487 /ORGANISM="Stephanopyxis turris, Strain CCMP 815" /LENGTH=119 /DNA_ID=CAMNT_0040649531 /DNA_START=83 /DNA_END=442 /DNA_ORIENTATION=+